MVISVHCCINYRGGVGRNWQFIYDTKTPANAGVFIIFNASYS